MKTYPAIAVIEISNIAAGLKTADAMVKKSPIALLKWGTVSKGKFIILVGGSVASVDEAYQEGLRISGTDCLDSLYLPDVHPRVYAALLGERVSAAEAAVGVLETPTLATNILAADAAIKGAEVEILEIRMGENYHGKGYTIFNGKVEDVEAAVHLACQKIELRQGVAVTCIIPRFNEELFSQLSGPMRFGESGELNLSDGEKDVTG